MFVRDYVQLHFDPIAGSRWTYPLLTLFTWPTVHDRTGRRGNGDAGYRAPCATGSTARWRERP